MKTKKIAVMMLVIMTMIFANIGTVFAHETEHVVTDNGITSIDSSGNMAMATDSDLAKSKDIKKDFYWAGESFLSPGMTVGYDAIMAGRNITLNQDEIKGAARIAAENINLTDVKIGHNASMAAKSIVISGATMDTGYFVAQNLNFEGKAECLHIGGNTVTIGGTINGDVEVTADNLTIEPGTVIKGTLKGEVGAEPTIGEGAAIGKVATKVVVHDEDKDQEDKDNNFGFGFMSWWFGVVALMWLIMRFFMRKPVEEAGEIMMTKPGKMAAVGAIVMFLLPIAAIVIAITIIGIPISIILGMLYTTMILISIPFAGSAAGQALFGKFVPKMNPWGSTIIGVAALFLLCEIPVIKTILHIAAVMFTIAYFSMALYDKHMRKTQKKEEVVDGGFTTEYVYAPVNEEDK